MPTWKLTRVDRDVKIRWPVDKPAASVIKTGAPIREKRARNEHKDTLKRVEVIFIEFQLARCRSCARKERIASEHFNRRRSANQSLIDR